MTTARAGSAGTITTRRTGRPGRHRWEACYSLAAGCWLVAYGATRRAARRRLARSRRR